MVWTWLGFAFLVAEGYVDCDDMIAVVGDCSCVVGRREGLEVSGPGMAVVSPEYKELPNGVSLYAAR